MDILHSQANAANSLKRRIYAPLCGEKLSPGVDTGQYAVIASFSPSHGAQGSKNIVDISHSMQDELGVCTVGGGDPENRAGGHAQGDFVISLSQ